MTEYVAGFLFDDDMESVLLVRKKRPEWQAGRLNAIGGHIENGESPLYAMRREFCEETELVVHDWWPICGLSGEDSCGNEWKVHFFYAIAPLHVLGQAKSVDEPIGIFATKHTSDRLPNLEWLIPMARSLRSGVDRAHHFKIVEKYGAAAF